MHVEIEKSVKVCKLKCGGIAITTDCEERPEDETVLAIFTDYRDFEPFWEGFFNCTETDSEAPGQAGQL